MTAQIAMRATKSELYTALFAGGKKTVRLPADVSVRLQSGQLQPGDAAAPRAAGYEQQLNNVSVFNSSSRTNVWLNKL